MADVAAHVIGSMADVVSGRLEGLGSPEVTAREVAERTGRSPIELATELAELFEPVVRDRGLILVDEEDTGAIVMIVPWCARPGGLPV